MSYRLNIENLREFMSETSDSCEHLVFPQKRGIYRAQKEWIASGITLFKCTLRAEDEVVIEQKESAFFGGAFIHVVLEGGVSFETSQPKGSFEYRRGYTTAMEALHPSGITRVARGVSVRSIGIHIHEDFLRSREIEWKKIAKEPRLLPSNPKVEWIAKSLYQGRGGAQSDADRLRVESQILEILSCELQREETRGGMERVKLSGYDLEALHKARVILEQNLKNPPSLIELSRAIHLNEFKLKFGFKRLFGVAPYEMLFLFRMQRARGLLEEGIFSVGEVAKEVGYAQQSSFSAAFFRHFGVLPKEVAKSWKD